MEVLVRNAEGNLSTQDREYASSKLSRLDRYFQRAQRVEIVHRELPHGLHRVEVTVFADGFTLRGEEQDHSIRSAIDLVADKLDQRLLRLKTRIIDSHRRKGSKAPAALVEAESTHEEGNPFRIAEHKHFLIKPMSPEEAGLQMELVDHDFFIFRNEGTNALEVLYRRRDGKYGLLQPEG